MLSHGAVPRKNGFSPDQLEAIVRDFHNAGLEQREVLMIEYAQKVVLDASSTTQDDFDNLRNAGWMDEDILGITLAAVARALADKVFDALGTDPDALYKDPDEETHQALLGKRRFVTPA